MNSAVEQAVRINSSPTVETTLKSKTKNKRVVKVFVTGCVWLLSIITAAILGVIGYVEVDRYLSQQSWFQKLSKRSVEKQEPIWGNEQINYKEGEACEINDKISEIVEKVSPAVVSVAKVSTKFNTSDAIGTGFIIDNQNGYLLTNQHVVSDQKAKYVIVTNDGKKYDVLKIYRDDANDIAILKVAFGAEKPKQVEFGDSDLLKVGQMVIAIGNPLGEYPGTVTHGIVSGLHRNVEAGDALGNTKAYEDVIQTDAAINFGNSGGPLLNMSGQVIGVNFGINRSNEAEGISFAMPINKVKERLSVFNKHGYFPKPYLGVIYEMIGEIESLMYGIPRGAYIQSVVSGSPAAKAGIQRGDIVVEVDGKPLEMTLSSVIQRYEIGDKIKLKIWRTSNGAEQTFEVEVELEDGGKL